VKNPNLITVQKNPQHHSTPSSSMAFLNTEKENQIENKDYGVAESQEPHTHKREDQD